MEYELQTDVINLSASLEFILTSGQEFQFGGGGVTAKSFTGGHCQDF